MVLIASWNVNSITVRLEAVLKWLTHVKPDVLCLQETKIIDEKFPAAAFEQAGYQSIFVGQPAYNGVAIVAKKPITAVQKYLKVEGKPDSKRFIQANIGKLTVVNTYVPNGQEVNSEKFSYKLNFLQSIKKHLAANYDSSQLIIWCGDFNIAPEGIDTYDAMSTDGQIMCSEMERSALKEIGNIGFIDIFRMLNSEPGHFSWWDYRMGAFRRNLGYRIDHIWTNKVLADLCPEAWMDKEPRKWERPSDHIPVLAQFNI